MRPIIFSVLFCLFLSPVFAAYEPPSSEIILFVDEEGGMNSSLSNLVRVPLFCLYKDGRTLYSARDSSGSIHLMDTKLSQEAIDEICLLLSKCDEWNDTYENVPMPDMPLLRITYNNNTDVKRFSVRGIDYAAKAKLIPADLIRFYRHISGFSDESAKYYDRQDIYLYVKAMDGEPRGPSVYIFKWRSKVSLAPIASDASVSGYGAAIVTGKQAKGVLKTLDDRVPYVTSDLPVYFKQGKTCYSIGFRPLLPHENSDQ